MIVFSAEPVSLLSLKEQEATTGTYHGCDEELRKGAYNYLLYTFCIVPAVGVLACIVVCTTMNKAAALNDKVQHRRRNRTALV